MFFPSRFNISTWFFSFTFIKTIKRKHLMKYRNSNKIFMVFAPSLRGKSVLGGGGSTLVGVVFTTRASLLSWRPASWETLNLLSVFCQDLELVLRTNVAGKIGLYFCNFLLSLWSILIKTSKEEWHDWTPSTFRGSREWSSGAL